MQCGANHRGQIVCEFTKYKGESAYASGKVFFDKLFEARNDHVGVAFQPGMNEVARPFKHESPLIVRGFCFCGLLHQLREEAVLNEGD